MIGVVSRGRPGTPMAGWRKRLGPKGVEALVDYVRNTLATRAEPHSALADRPGEALYVRYCASCHGEDGAGSEWARSSLSTLPTDFTNPRLAARLSRDRIVFSTVNGRPGTAMPGYSGRLEREDIGHVADYVVQLMNQQANAPSSVDEPAGPGMATPDPDNGERLYRAFCEDCHGTSGDGDGPRARLSQPPPGSLKGRALEEDSILKAIRNGIDGTSMPAWQHVLDAQELLDLNAYVYGSIARQDLP